ncbi:MAG: DUF1080 domain-containing protein [Verrucomicrobia subdivision 3 bacterium]|nr:DUF1080 domain-containing protein [Limisphaerales bacterium]
MTSMRLFFVALFFSVSGLLAGEPNTLSKAEKAAGWQLLFDGKNINAHWRNLGQKEVTGAGWVIKEGVLIKEEGRAAGNILTRRTWTDYEFTWEWQVGVKGNNGVKYMVLEKRGAIGHEYQMIDDSFWQKSPLSLTGVFYAVLPRDVKLAEPVRINKWNQSRIKVLGQKVEHWLNGEKILSYTLGSERVLAGVAKSKFKKFEGFGKKVTGHILLTDHKDRCAFRNLKIRELK